MIKYSNYNSREMINSECDFYSYKTLKSSIAPPISQLNSEISLQFAAIDKTDIKHVTVINKTGKLMKN